MHTAGESVHVDIHPSSTGTKLLWLRFPLRGSVIPHSCRAVGIADHRWLAAACWLKRELAHLSTWLFATNFDKRWLESIKIYPNPSNFVQKSIRIHFDDWMTLVQNPSTSQCNVDACQAEKETPKRSGESGGETQ